MAKEKNSKEVIEELAKELQAVKSNLKEIESSTKQLATTPTAAEVAKPENTKPTRAKKGKVSTKTIEKVKPKTETPQHKNAQDFVSEVATSKHHTHEFLESFRSSFEESSAIEERNRIKAVEEIISETHALLDGFRNALHSDAEKQRQERLDYVERLYQEAEKQRQERLDYVERLYQETEKTRQERFEYMEHLRAKSEAELDEFLQRLENDSARLQQETHTFLDTVRADLADLRK